MSINSNRIRNNESVKQRSLFSKIIKFFLIILCSLIFALAAFSLWIYLSLFSGPGAFEISSSHPFKSEKDKIRYLALEEKMAKEWKISSDEKYIETSFGKTFVRISGPVNAPPLVLLPGGGSNSLIWKANISALSKNYRTYALDNIYDFGRSIYMRKMENGKDYADWLNELFDTLHLEKNIRLLGYSYGGWVVSQYVLQHPERLSSAILLAPAFTVLPLKDDYIFKMILSLLPVRYFKEKILYWVWSDLANMGKYGTDLVEERIEYYDMALKTFKFKNPVNPTVLTDDELQGIKIPLLFIAGENETAYNAVEAIQRLNKINPGIKTALIHGTGHDLMFTHTESVNKFILDFLKRSDDKSAKSN